ncbi:unnamed protein product [Protopolystoma xenopodis]|uniref:Uncharacterized protein n=1 Tax=Protopolystoma xenopodis TaxID=117903 RepID=A0A448WAL7_9PLAT|nr:unnamed protein product [Protopolystoma xenopodis]
MPFPFLPSVDTLDSPKLISRTAGFSVYTEPLLPLPPPDSSSFSDSFFGSIGVGSACEDNLVDTDITVTEQKINRQHLQQQKALMTTLMISSPSTAGDGCGGGFYNNALHAQSIGDCTRDPSHSSSNSGPTSPFALPLTQVPLDDSGATGSSMACDRSHFEGEAIRSATSSLPSSLAGRLKKASLLHLPRLRQRHASSTGPSTNKAQTTSIIVNAVSSNLNDLHSTSAATTTTRLSLALPTHSKPFNANDSNKLAVLAIRTCSKQSSGRLLSSIIPGLSSPSHRHRVASACITGRSDFANLPDHPLSPEDIPVADGDYQHYLTVHAFHPVVPVPFIANADCNNRHNRPCLAKHIVSPRGIITSIQSPALCSNLSVGQSLQIQPTTCDNSDTNTVTITTRQNHQLTITSTRLSSSLSPTIPPDDNIGLASPPLLQVTSRLLSPSCVQGCESAKFPRAAFIGSRFSEEASLRRSPISHGLGIMYTDASSSRTPGL